ncbi:MAG: SUMF1/EgtB/PvdO family nonheme iron enzyme [Lentisphaeria bacterium]|nr:SUMF1/EgtB/PvdO family nonheme iron enzyme [Lentisphaeria bacterium]
MTTHTGDTTTAVTRLMHEDADKAQLTEQEILDLLGPQGDDWKNFGRMRTIGLGGVGEVFSATEPGLRRYMAVKVLRSQYRSCRNQVETFIREARITAQIEHPNIVPVHRIGYSSDAGVYFTMKEIAGRDLRTIIRALREKKTFADRFVPLNRRLEIFIAVCQGIAFAHSKGVVHCDLKPANIMVGNFGEVMIMDWGLALYRNENDFAHAGQRIDLEHRGDLQRPEESVRDLPAGAVRVSGTPAFMSPEQASGMQDLIDEKSDIYGLGTILYCLLTLESAPIYPERPTDDVLFDAARGRIIRPRRRAPLRAIPRELEAITMKALAFDREDRYCSVEELLEDVRHYMEKFPVNAYRTNWFYKMKKLAVRRPLIPLALLAACIAGGGVVGLQAVEENSRVEMILNRVRYSRMQADAYYKLASRTYRNLQRGQSNVSEQEFLRQEIEFSNYTNAALEGISMIEFRKGFSRMHKQEMLTLLSHLIRQQIELCHLTGNTAVLQPMIRQFQTRWRNYALDLFEISPNVVLAIRQIARNLSSIHLQVPEKASVMIRSENPDRNSPGEWTTVQANDFGQLPSGSYLIQIVYAGGREVFLPVKIDPGQRVEWDLRSLPESPEGFILVKGGAFHVSRASGQDTRLRHLPDFFIQKYEVTIGDYLEFWKQLKCPDLKNLYRAVYREAGELGKFPWDENGVLHPDFHTNMPIFGISGPAAEAYCRYRSEKTGMLHRLPTQLEWEKAACGADGRRFVWGNMGSIDAAFTADHPFCRHHSFAVPGGSFPKDRSVYGAWDMAGNLREMVRNPEDSGSIYRLMGGSYQLGHLQSTTFHLGSTNNGVRDAGFRCVIEIPQKADETNL